MVENGSLTNKLVVSQFANGSTRGRDTLWTGQCAGMFWSTTGIG